MSDPMTISIKALRHFADGGDPFGDGPPLLTVDSDFFKGLVERLATAEAAVPYLTADATPRCAMTRSNLCLGEIRTHEDHCTDEDCDCKKPLWEDDE